MVGDPFDAVQAAAEARIGQTVRGKYHLDELIGVGGMAAVYAATHRNGKRFAVKILHAELSTRADIRDRFLREGYLANRVNHPGAVAVLDDDVSEDGSAFLVMELLQGSPVAALWESRGAYFPLRVVLSLADGLLDVLGAAHESHVVHRDINPSNLFLTRDGAIKVLDFGIARLRDMHGAKSATRTGTAVGTPAFMAPEQALGKAPLIDEQTDVWSAGATMFTLLSGSFVHEAETPAELVVFAGSRPARSLASVAPEVPARVAQIVDKALRFEKRERWRDASEMRDAVRAAYREIFGEAVSNASLLALVTRPSLLEISPTVDAKPADPDASPSSPPSSADAGDTEIIVTPGDIQPPSTPPPPPEQDASKGDRSRLDPPTLPRAIETPVGALDTLDLRKTQPMARPAAVPRLQGEMAAAARTAQPVSRSGPGTPAVPITRPGSAAAWNALAFVAAAVVVGGIGVGAIVLRMRASDTTVAPSSTAPAQATRPLVASTPSSDAPPALSASPSASALTAPAPSATIPTVAFSALPTVPTIPAWVPPPPASAPPAKPKPNPNPFDHP